MAGQVGKKQNQDHSTCQCHHPHGPMRGKQHSAVTKAKMCAAHLGQVPWNKGLTGLSQLSNKANTGRQLSLEHRTRISQGRQRHFEQHGSACQCLRAHHVTQLSRDMIAIFLSEFPEVIAEKAFGRYRVDAYLPPPYHLAFEADGEYWHDRRGRDFDERRDAYLLGRFSLPVVRLTGTEITEARDAN